MSLIALVYVSFAKNKNISNDELEEILKEAREKNAKRDITGVLLYRNGFFVQSLEGEKEAVEETYNKITKDPRHNHILMLYKQKIEEPSFKDWSMGFSVLDDDVIKSVEGFNNLDDPQFTMNVLKENPNHVKTLLRTFKRI